MDLDLLSQEVARRAPTWTASGASWEIRRGTQPPKPAVSLRIETTDGLAELTIWVSGEADLSWVRPTPDADICVEHYEISGELGLRGCMDDLEGHLGIRT